MSGANRALILDQGPTAWFLSRGATALEPEVARSAADLDGEYAVVLWGEPGFELQVGRLGALGSPLVLSPRGEVVAAARAQGLQAHRLPSLEPAVVLGALSDERALLAVPVGTVDLRTGSVWADAPASLTDTERRLLGLLLERDEVVDRDELGREVLGQGAQVVSRAVDAAIARLRKKLGNAAIVTAFGRGYRFAEVVRPRAPAPPAPGVNSPRPGAAPRRFGDALVDLERRTVAVRGTESALSEQSVRLLALLEAAGTAGVSRRRLAQELGISPRAVNDAIRRLRQKVESDPASPTTVVSCPSGVRLAHAPVSALAPPTGSPDDHTQWVARVAREADLATGRPPPLPDAAELARAWVDLADSDPESASIIACVLVFQFDLPAAERRLWVDRASVHPPERRRALLWVARSRCEMASGRLDEAERCALEACRTEPSVVSAFTTAHLLAALRGDSAAALARLDEADARFGTDKPMSRANIAGSRAWWALRQGDPAEGLRVALAGLSALAAGVRSPGAPLGMRNRGVIEAHGMLLQVLAAAKLRLGHHAEALEAADEAIEELGRLPRGEVTTLMPRVTRSLVLAALGRLPEARAEIEATLAVADRRGEVGEVAALAGAHQIALALAAGEVDAARALLRSRGPSIRATGHGDAIGVLDRAAAALGEVDAAGPLRT